MTLQTQSFCSVCFATLRFGSWKRKYLNWTEPAYVGLAELAVFSVFVPRQKIIGYHAWVKEGARLGIFDVEFTCEHDFDKAVLT